LGLSIDNGDPGVKCTTGFDVQAQPNTFNTALVDGLIYRYSRAFLNSI